MLSEIKGFLCLQVVLAHAALFLHHLHIVSLSVFTLLVKIVFLLTSHQKTSSLTIPLLMTSATLAGVLVIFWIQWREENFVGSQNENEMLLRAMKKSAKSKRKSD